MAYKMGRNPSQGYGPFRVQICSLSGGLRIREHCTEFLRSACEVCVLASFEEDLARYRIEDETQDAPWITGQLL